MVYGDIPLSSNEIKFLEIPYKLRLIETVDLDQIRLVLDRVSCKLRYNLMDKSGDMDMSTVHPRVDKLQVDRHSKSIRLAGLRATDLQYNTRIYLPEQAGGREEMSIHNLKETVMDQCKLFSLNKCDTKGIINWFKSRKK